MDDNVRAVINENTKMILGRNTNNPLMKLVTLLQLQNYKRNNIMFWQSITHLQLLYLQRPLDLGADVVMHSATKFSRTL
jgi:O-acetylhomoserine/O-acetylserine sulfhydrylase-like pyridoxal-dependent enzyme